jgi:hypothetical protein
LKLLLPSTLKLLLPSPRYNEAGWGPVAGLRFLHYIITDPFDVVLDWPFILNGAPWQSWSDADKVKFVQQRDVCPPNFSCNVWWMNWKALGVALRWALLQPLVLEAEGKLSEGVRQAIGFDAVTDAAVYAPV